MFFNPKTKTYVGKLRTLTAEEEAEFDRRVAKGELYSTKHPSPEEIELLFRQREELGLNKELDDLMSKATEEDLASYCITF